MSFSWWSIPICADLVFLKEVSDGSATIVLKYTTPVVMGNQLVNNHGQKTERCSHGCK